ncbi:uncharacterized protein LDX57_003690 [Aspergillus melleus]|uniref:uncharacterized protein n=1 Tax=Aspergillus melleus TaxID=138277 RepID=UPI001E8E9320|nr:uncharacterized protein LDX57_003690 [Aspergillus melleus]KAH8425953.1 hypothetical protein LDX57_003690 [Aspergillus melleus]
MDLPTRDILTNPPAFPPSPATTTLFTNPPTTPIQTIQTYETPDRILTGIRITWTNGDTAKLGVCSDDVSGQSSSSGSGSGSGSGTEMNISAESKSTTGPIHTHNNEHKINDNSNINKTSDNKNLGTDTTTTTTSSSSKNPNPNIEPNLIMTKTFTFDRQERIQIMYIYVSPTQVEGFWFVTNKQKSFFPGRSSERREMSDLGSGVLVGIEGREKRDELDRVVGVLGLGVSFRR